MTAYPCADPVWRAVLSARLTEHEVVVFIVGTEPLAIAGLILAVLLQNSEGPFTHKEIEAFLGTCALNFDLRAFAGCGARP